MLIFLAIVFAIGVGLFHLAYWAVLIIGGVQILNSLQSKPYQTAPTDPEYSRPPAKDLELEANGHTVLFNRLMGKK